MFENISAIFGFFISESNRICYQKAKHDEIFENKNVNRLSFENAASNYDNIIITCKGLDLTRKFENYRQNSNSSLHNLVELNEIKYLISLST